MSDHPVVLAVGNGAATLPQLRLFTEQFYLHIRNMLPWIGQIYVTCPPEEVRTALVKNLAEERLGMFTNTKAHLELLPEFGEAIGLDSFVPDSFTRLVVGFKSNYGLTDEQLVFWTMHILADQEHGDEGIELVCEYGRGASPRVPMHS